MCFLRLDAARIHYYCKLYTFQQIIKSSHLLKLLFIQLNAAFEVFIYFSFAAMQFSELLADQYIISGQRETTNIFRIFHRFPGILKPDLDFDKKFKALID